MQMHQAATLILIAEIHLAAGRTREAAEAHRAVDAIPGAAARRRPGPTP